LNSTRSSTHLNRPDNLALKEEAYRFAVGLFPHVYAFLLRHFGALIQISMAPVAQRRNAVVVSLEPSAFAIAQLVGVGRYYSAVTYSTVLAR
jgi:hypothetical protein